MSKSNEVKSKMKQPSDMPDVVRVWYNTVSTDYNYIKNVIDYSYLYVAPGNDNYDYDYWRSCNQLSMTIMITQICYGMLQNQILNSIHKKMAHNIINRMREHP